MPSAVGTVASLYGPAVMAFLCIFLAFSRQQVGKDLEFPLPLWFLNVPIRIKSSTLKRLALVLAAGISVAFLLFRDYSGFFPTHLEMEVFYDGDGLLESLDAIGTSTLARLHLRAVPGAEAEKYYEELDSRVQRVVRLKAFTGFRQHAVHSTGKTTFKVSKAGPWQTYHVDDASGDLTHVAEAPGLPRITFVSYFERLVTKDDYVKPTVGDVLRGRAILLHPRFKQAVAENRTSTRETFEVSVVGVTGVRVFPWPEVSNTVYFADVPGIGLVPFAYAIYKF